jgi:3-methyladenine DNA glycosylase AlkD
MPTLQDVLKTLQALANPNTALITRRHGVTDEIWGVPYTATVEILKQVKMDHALAAELWETGIHEARVLATKLADPKALTQQQMDAWLKDASDYRVTDALSGLAARSPDVLRWALDWIGSKKEWPSSAGWNVVALLAMDGRLPEADAKALLVRIHKELRKAPNRTRHAMNGALISMGGAMKTLTRQALEVAQAIGPVKVDHGLTGCVTPEAAPYIARMLDHAAERTRVAAEKAAVVKKAAPPKAAPKKAAPKKAAPKKVAPKKKPKPTKKR